MIDFRLAFQSLWNRRLTSTLTVLSIALSVALFVSVERIRRAAEEGFTQSISQVDLIVGARSGPMNLLLYTVFNLGSATNNVSIETFDYFKKHPAVEWVIPYSLGDGHRGFRVVGTNGDFFEHYRFRGDKKIELQAGEFFKGLWSVVIGSEVAKNLDYKVGSKIVVSHGVTKGLGILHHDDKPFYVSGIMKATGTALDRSVYVTLNGLEALHIDWQDGAMPTKDKVISVDQIKEDQLKVTSITSFFLRTKSRIETLRLQREINTYKEEALLAIIPGMTLQELWQALGYVEKAFRVVAILVIIVGLVSMLIALLTSLNERRREMAIFRALGASPWRISGLLVFESGLLSLAGVVVGLFLQFVGFEILAAWLETEFGLVLTGSGLQITDVFYLGVMVVAGLIVALVPALSAHRMVLKDGLTVKT